MNSLDSIKKQIAFLYKNKPDIHVNISITHPRINLQNDPAKITGVYPNVFMIEEKSSGFTKRHSLQYTDILTNQIEIVELMTSEKKNSNNDTLLYGNDNKN